MRNSLNIQYSPLFSLKFSPECEEWFQQEWERKQRTAKENGVLLFKGPLFHVAGISREGSNISLKVGDTDYKEYVCSRGHEFSKRFPDQVSSKPLAACVALVTSDNKLLIEKRKGVDVHEGMYHVVGGFLDPSKDLDKFGNPDSFGSVVREVMEETGLMINRNQLVFLDIAEDTTVPHFELCFYSKLGLNSKEVIETITCAKKDGEFNKPILIDLSKEKIVTFLTSNESLISPTGKACIEMMLSKIYSE